MFADDDGNVIGTARDYKQTEYGGYIYLVPSGATKLYFSANCLGTDVYATTYRNRGYVILEGIFNISDDKFTISQYGYNGDGFGVYVNYMKLLNGDTVNTWMNNMEKAIAEKANGKIYYCKKDGSGDFNSLVTAITTLSEQSNATLVVGDGTWDICAEYGAEMETMSSSKRGLYLKNGIHVICSSRALIVAKYTGTNNTVREWFSAFNAGVGGFTLENARIETDNIRYTVHDERDSDADRYTNHYLNCDMTHTNGFYVQCIGGGLGLDGHIIVEGCRFKGRVYQSQGTALVSWHNSADGAWDGSTPKGAKSFIEIKGNYFEDKGGVQLINFGKSDKVTIALVHGNSMGMPIDYKNGSKYYYDNIAVKDYCNEYRN